MKSFHAFPALLSNQRGFTLLEIMVAIVIIALLSAISIPGLELAGERPRLAEAGRIQAWMQQLADRSLLDGAAYGIQLETAPGGGSHLQALVYYRNHWYPLEEPEALALARETTLAFPPAVEATWGGIRLPAVVLSEGVLIPQEPLQISFTNSDARFALQWQAESGLVDLLPEKRRP
jgi:prepilin-type N-terminal cleavage/methylation domain-containing protein